MFCSTIIPTIARPSLTRAVQSVLDQEFPAGQFEVVVVNDSGQPLPREGWQQSGQVRILDTQRRERIFARNSGAAAARGRYLHFLDDDDWLAPGALQHFWELAQSSQADWLYGSSQLVDRQGKPLIRLRHEMNGNCFVQVMAGEWIPLQSSLIKAETFFAAGGFTPLLFVTQDIDLCRRILLRGDLAGTPALVAWIGMGLQNSSTDYGRASELSRWARERILDEPGVWTRLQDSARTADWQGRVLRIYLTSSLWNLKRRRLFTALSRLAHSCTAAATAGKHLLSPAYWSSAAHSYQSATFLKGFQEANLPVETRDARISARGANQ